MNIFLRILIIIVSIIFLLGYIVLGLIIGFPWEHGKAVSNAKKYVIKNYNLTPTKLTSSIGPDGSVSVIITTKELDFVFNVYMGRRNLNKMRDNYLVKMVNYILTLEINDYVNEITKEQGHARVYVINTQMIESFSLPELKANPDLVFERLQEDYTCSISFYDDITRKDYAIDYNLVYDVYNKIFEIGLEPARIFFIFYDKYDKLDESLLIRIDEHHFSNINSPEDLKLYFEEARKN